MRLSKPIETSGVFWLPDAPEDKLPGSLRISTSGATTLEVAGIFGNPQATFHAMGVTDKPLSEEEPPDLRRIVGRVEHGGLVTLDVCATKSVNFGSNAKSIILALYAFFGVSYDKEEKIAFSEVKFSASGLDEWLSISGITFEQHSRTSGSIHFRIPDEISLNLPGDIQLEFNFDLTVPGGPVLILETGVKQKAYAKLTLKESKSIEDILPIIRKLCNFLSFAIDQTVPIDSITGYVGNPPKAVKAYSDIGPHPEKEAKILQHKMLFSFNEVSVQLEQSLTKWLEGYEELGPVFDLYFASKGDPAQYIETEFLQLAQAVEVLHRRRHQETVMSETEFEGIVDSLVESCPEDRKSWLKDKLRYANELSLRKRMLASVKPFEDYFGGHSVAKTFVNDFVKARNYLTHYSSTAEAVPTQGLWPLTRKVEALLQIHLLRLIGIDPEPIVEKNSRIRGNLGL